MCLTLVESRMTRRFALHAMFASHIKGWCLGRLKRASLPSWMILRTIPALLPAALLASCAATSLRSSEQDTTHCRPNSDRSPVVECPEVSCRDLQLAAESLRNELATQWARIGRSPFPQTELDWFWFTYALPIEAPLALAKIARAEIERTTTFESRRVQLAKLEGLLREKKCPGAMPQPDRGEPARTGIEPDWLRMLPRPWYMPKAGDLEPPRPP
jgi:hypothetical protein